MSRYIDAGALKEKINTAFWSEIGKVIDDAPSIDIVRCKECYMCDEEMWCSFYDSIMESDDFCSYGERKESE